MIAGGCIISGASRLFGKISGAADREVVT